MEKVIIIGAGPAGISAALYTARGNMEPLIIYNGIGDLEKAEKIENYYGLEAPLSGRELFERGISQAKALGVRFVKAQVLGITGFDTFTVKTTVGDFDTESVILATGGKRSAPKFRESVNSKGKASAIVRSATRFSTEEKKWRYLATAILPCMRRKNLRM